MKLPNYIQENLNHSYQQELFNSFKLTGIPNRKNDLYRFSEIQKVFVHPWEAPQPGDTQKPNDSDFFKPNLIIGQTGEILFSEFKIEPIELTSKHITIPKDPLKALALSQAKHVNLLKLDGNKKLSIKYLSTANMTSNSLLVIESNGDNEIVEYFGPEHKQTMIQSSLLINIQTGTLDYYKLDNLDSSSTLFHFPHIKLQDKSSRLNFKQLVLSGGIQRFTPEVQLLACENHVNFQTFYALNQGNALDVAAKISHLKEGTTSNQEVIGTLQDQSKCIFTGRIFIDHHCSDVQANQYNKNLLLGKKAHALSQPQLEIFNDDVKCSHGSTTGQISQDELFYLQSRGLSKLQASKMLISSLAEKFFQDFRNTEVKTKMKEAYIQSLQSLSEQL